MTRWPGGHWLFSRAVCLKAPYFASIAPRIENLAPHRYEASLRHRRRVSNHIGTVHAIALCNLAELSRADDRRQPAAVDALDPQGLDRRLSE